MSFDVEKLKPFDEFSSEKSAGVNELVYGLSGGDGLSVVKGINERVKYGILITMYTTGNITVPAHSMIEIEKNKNSLLDGYTVFGTFPSIYSNKYCPLTCSGQTSKDNDKMTLYLHNGSDTEYNNKNLTIYVLHFVNL